jgi:nicotinate-nucleotide pyrophosphorylase (carboxylating)
MSDLSIYGLSPEELLRFALAEDTGDGDHTSLSTIEPDKSGSAIVKAKEGGIIAGTEIAGQVLKMVDPSISFRINYADGLSVKSGDVILVAEGNLRNLLRAERLLLNCMQRMSGIATLTNKFIKETKGTQAKILDTRKTTPNFRYFEKLAVIAGGGTNHRYGLFDMILIKDNHVDAAGSITAALKKAKEYLEKSSRNLKIEIETRNLREVEEALQAGLANRIMLDNFIPEKLEEAVKIINNKAETEASGGITLSNVREYALTGVNFISVGALTHSYKSMDISMKLE